MICNKCKLQHVCPYYNKTIQPMEEVLMCEEKSMFYVYIEKALECFECEYVDLK